MNKAKSSVPRNCYFPTRRRGNSMSIPARPYGHAGMMMGLVKPINFKKTFKILLKYLTPYKLILCFVLIAAIFGTVFNVIGPKVMGNTITVIFDGAYAKLQGVTGAAINFSMVGKLLLLLASLYVFARVFQFIQGFIVGSVAQKTVYQLREDVCRKTNNL